MSSGKFSQERVDLVDKIIFVTGHCEDVKDANDLLYIFSLDCIEHAFLRMLVYEPHDGVDKIKDEVFQTLQCCRTSLLRQKPFPKMKKLLEEELLSSIAFLFPYEKILWTKHDLSFIRILQACADVLSDTMSFAALAAQVSDKTSTWSCKNERTVKKNEIQWQHERLEWILSVFKFSEHRFRELLFDDGALPFPGQDDLPGRFSRVRMRSQQRPTRGEDSREHNHLRVHRRV